MSLFSPQVSRSFTQRKALKTSPNAAKPAAMPENNLPKLPKRCLTQYVLPAAPPARFLSDPVRTDLYTAASALQK